MTADRETIPEYLDRIYRKDLAKHERAASGFRTTREVADYFGITMSQARHRLNDLFGAGEIDCHKDGRTGFWRSLKAGE